MSETAFDGWPATPVHTNRGRVLERAAVQPQIFPVDGRREVEPAVVVGQLHLGQAIAAQIDLKAQRIPASLVRILEVGPHRLLAVVIGDVLPEKGEYIGLRVLAEQVLLFDAEGRALDH